MSARHTCEKSQYAVHVQGTPLAHDPPTGTRGTQVLMARVGPGLQKSDTLVQDSAPEFGKLTGLHEPPVGAG